MPAIMIGVGGVGGAVVADVRRKLDLRVNKSGGSPAARQQRDQYKFFLVDTKEESFSHDFKQNERFVIPASIDKFYVDEKVTRWYASDGRGDDFFRNWWPEQNENPYLVGDFDEGAGQIRIKGKLAYRIHIAQGKGTIVDAVDEAVRTLRSARGLGANRDLHKIPVYIVASLGGGTGSGIVLTLAKHLRRTLPTYCVLQGVFMLASIAALAPGKADEASIWANTDAALREIDYYQRPPAHRRDQPTPYLEWPGAGNRISNQEAPFQYIYLFSRGNREALTLNSLIAYTQLVSECLVAETFDDIGELIKGPHSQFVARFVEAPEVEGRSTCYASAGIAGVRYPSERIIQHLSRTFGARVIAQAFDHTALDTDSLEETEARTFLQDRGDLWEGSRPIREEFRAPLPDEETMPDAPTLDDDAFLDAGQEEIEAIVNERLREFSAWRSRQLIPFLNKQRQARETAMLKSETDGLREFLDKQFKNRADGVPRVLNALAVIHKLLREQIELTEKAIGVRERAGGDDDGTGLHQTVKEEKEGLQEGIKGLKDGFGKFRDKSGKTAKAQYAGRWNQYVANEVDLAVAQQVLPYYTAVQREVEATQNYLKELIVAAKNKGLQLQLEARDDLGANIKDSVLSVGILDDVTIVDYHFRDLMDSAIAQHADALIIDLITGDRGLAHALRSKVNKRAGVRQELVLDDFREAIAKAVLDAGRERFAQAVESMTIWDAIKHECVARKEIPLEDDDFRLAKTDLNEYRDFMQRAGTPLPNGDKYLLQQFIQAKLARLRRQAAPFWQLDHVEQSNFGDQTGLLYPVTVLAFDRRKYDDFVTRENLDPDMIHAIAENIGVEPQHLANADAIRLYCREGVAPLFFLSEKERAQLRNSAARISNVGVNGRTKEIYTDIRLKNRVDPIIAPPERREDLRKYALGLLIESVTGPAAENGHATWIRWKTASDEVVEHASVNEAMEELREDPELEKALFAAVNANFSDPVSDRGYGPFVANAIQRAKDLQATRDPVEKQWWQQTINVLNRRLNDAQYRV